MRNNSLCIFIFLILISGFYCKSESEKFISRGIEYYKNGDRGNAVRNLGEGIVRLSSSMEFTAGNSASSGDVLYMRNGNIINILRPVEANIRISPDYSIISIRFDGDMIAISNGTDIKIYSPAADELHTVSPEIKDHKIKSIIYLDERVIFYLDEKLYSYNPEKNSIVPFLPKETFSPPYNKGSYSVNMMSGKKIFAVTVGIAGTYYTSLISIPNYAIIIKNLTTSTLNIVIEDDAILALTGSIGNWDLEKISIPSKKRTSIYKFNDLSDIFISNDCVIYENSKGKNLLSYHDKKTSPIPFSYDFRSCNGKEIFISLEERLHLVKFKEFTGTIINIRQQTPDLFSEK
jgi:hypothetical protein